MTEAELVFTHILNCDRAELYLERDVILDKTVSSQVSAVLERRISGEPLAYILGKQEFMGLEFEVDSSVFIPRMETEILVETAIKYASSRPRPLGEGLKMLDIGTGSGNIAVSLAAFLPDAVIHAVDMSQEALSVAGKNARLNKVEGRIEFLHGDLFAVLQDVPCLSASYYDFIITNPPYIPSGEIPGLQPEVNWEPRSALDGGMDGLDFYRRIIKDAPRYLKEGGFLFMEMGFGQRDAIENIFCESGVFGVVEVIKDYSGIERVIVGSHLSCQRKPCVVIASPEGAKQSKSGIASSLRSSQ